MKLLSKEEVLKRKGWNKDKITCFLGKELHLKEGTGYTLSKIYRSESSEIFDSFSTIDEFNKLKENLELDLKNNKNETIARFLEQKPHIDDAVSLLKQLDKYKVDDNLSKEIIHWINKENINQDDKYDLFTDGSLKIEGEKNIISCSGWIRNQNGDPVLEFVKNIDEKSLSSFYDFEIFGLEMGLKIAQSLGIKKLNVYSDSAAEIKTLSFMKEGFMSERMLDLAEIYFPMKEIIKEMQIKLSYIPRDDNYYADSLSKIYTDEYKKYLKNVLEEQRLIGYDPNNNESQYYTNSKIENLTELKEEGILFVQRHMENHIYQFYIDMKSKEILSVETISLKKAREQLREENRIFEENRNVMDSIQLALLTKEIGKNHEKGYKNINIAHPSLGIKCRLENIVRVTNEWKKNYINLDNEINKMDKISFVPLTESLRKLTKKWFIENNIKENNIKEKNKKTIKS